ncbi:unnamed protein product [Cochlearia groenlandica]
MGNELNTKMIKCYKTKVEDEISKICYDMLDIIDKHLIPAATSRESIIIYHQKLFSLQGDYFRYLAEFKSGVDRDEVADQSLKAYEAATAIARSEFGLAHPIRLNLANNFSIFYYDIMNSPER